jgi:hypothetical protein
VAANVRAGAGQVRVPLSAPTRAAQNAPVRLVAGQILPVTNSASAEDSIVARLRENARPAGGAAGGGSASGAANAGTGTTVARTYAPGALVAGWARGRSLTPGSATGISLALGLCAAAWFTAGTRVGDINGALALCGCYLAGRAAGEGAAGQDAAGQGAAGQEAAWRWPARMFSAAAECAVYAGLAVGADSAGRGSTWELAVIMTVLLAVRQTMTPRHDLRQRDTCERGTGERGTGERGAGERGAGERGAGERGTG